MHIDDLPTEMLLHILSFLSLKELCPVEVVSQLWRSAFNICLSRVKDFRFDWPNDITNETLQLLLPRMSSLRAINIVNNDMVRGFSSRLELDMVSRHCRHLAEIDLRPFRVTVPGLHRLCLFCPRLEVITMNCWCNDACLEVLLSHQPKLRQLTMRGPHIGVGELRWGRKAAECLSQLPASLERLRISDWRRCVYEGADVIGHVARCEQLRQLELENVSRLGSAELRRVLSCCSRLERLSLRGSPVMAQDSLRSLVACARLRELDLSQLEWVRPAELAAGLAGCVRLERLTAVALSYPLEKCLPQAGLPALRQLIVRRAAGVTDATLQRLPILLPGLRSLDVSFCRELTEEGLRRLSLLTRLRALMVAGVPAVSDILLDCMIPPRLAALELGCADTFAELVSVEAVTRLVLRCRGLRRLTFYDKLSRVRSVVEGLVCRLAACRDVTLVLYPGFPRRLPPLSTGPLRLTDTAAARRLADSCEMP